MVIDQRNAGASVTPTATTYTLDRFYASINVASKFSVQQNAGSVTLPAGYINYLGVTSLAATTVGSTDYYQIRHSIEGLNIADLAWGTASAKTVTLSFLVYSSLTGTFSVSLFNSAENRFYPSSYTISSANTWTQISITVPGDTTGTWLTTNGKGITVNFGLGLGSTYTTSSANAWTATSGYGVSSAVNVVGTNGATWYVTGVQLEVGSSATGFEVVDYTTQLVMCQRYFEKSYNYSVVPGTATTDGLYYQLVAGNTSTSNYGGALRWSVTKRTAITFTSYDTLGASGKCNTDGQGTGQTLSVVFGSQTGALCYVQSLNNPTALSFHWTASAEL